MKGSQSFKDTITNYLEARAASDELFAVTYAKEGKNIDDCCTYIMNEVQKSGCNGFDDHEIYSMAVHYYDEDNLKVEKGNSNTRVVVNHVVEITEEEKAEAKQKALRKLEDEARAKMQKKPTVKKLGDYKSPDNVNQPNQQASLF